MIVLYCVLVIGPRKKSSPRQLFLSSSFSTTSYFKTSKKILFLPENLDKCAFRRDASERVTDGKLAALFFFLKSPYRACCGLNLSSTRDLSGAGLTTEEEV